MTFRAFGAHNHLLPFCKKVRKNGFSARGAQKVSFCVAKFVLQHKFRQEEKA
jgi:hypothetical protein